MHLFARNGCSRAQDLLTACGQTLPVGPRSFSVHTPLFLTFSSPQDRPARQILAFETRYFTVFGTEGSKVVNHVHDCSMTITDFGFSLTSIRKSYF